ncbi:hypothetical protein J6590_030098 [Homalodisca vitripennis]|nr:hypothetical protein J6590_030098 [Homalodisca vitripennis]
MNTIRIQLIGHRPADNADNGSDSYAVFYALRSEMCRPAVNLLCRARAFAFACVYVCLRACFISSVHLGL